MPRVERASNVDSHYAVLTVCAVSRETQDAFEPLSSGYVIATEASSAYTPKAPYCRRWATNDGPPTDAAPMSIACSRTANPSPVTSDRAGGDGCTHMAWTCASWLDRTATLVQRAQREEAPPYGPVMASDAIERVWGSLPSGARQVLETGLSATDLQTLLIDLARTRAGTVEAAGLLQRWKADRFVQPAATDPAPLAEIEYRIWQRLRNTEFVGLVLSPITPLGSCRAIGPVDQNRIISTVRTSEVVSDPTNVLALEAARRRRAVANRATDPVHVAACHRVVRAQRFRDPRASAHFSLFALVSSARDRGSAHTEAALLIDHLDFWWQVLADAVGSKRARLVWTVIDSEPMRERLNDEVCPALGEATLIEDPDRTQAIGYYRTAAFKIMVETERGFDELGDGGFTDWTAKLIPDAKERCLISCISTERLVAVATGPGGDRNPC